MRVLAIILITAAMAFGGDVAKADQHAAAKAYREGIKIEAKDAARAFDLFDQAVNLEPTNTQYLQARELTRQKLVFAHTQKANELLNSTTAGAHEQAENELRAALALDPANDFALQRLQEAFQLPVPQLSKTLKLVASDAAIRLQVAPGRFDYDLRADTRQLITKICTNHGLIAVFDDSFRNRPLRFKAQNLDFVSAIDVPLRVSKAFISPIDEIHVFILGDNIDNHRQFDRMVLRTFYISDSTAPQQMNDILTLMRTIFDIRFVTMQADKGMLTIRAPQPVLENATRFLDSFDAARPQVRMDVQVVEVNRSAVRALGLQLPLSYRIFNIPAAALLAAANPNIQDLINQLIAGGGINQAGNQTIAALLAQLQSQQTSILAQPFLTFGHGKFLFAAGIPPLKADFNYTESKVKSLQQLSLRAADDTEATMRIGTRFPIINASFSPIFNSSAIAKVIGNQTFTAPFPSVSYEDLGVNLKMKPQVNHSFSDLCRLEKKAPGACTSSADEVTLTLDLQIRSLTGQDLNGLPVISNRQYTGAVRLQDGEAAVLAGSLSESDQRTISGPIGIGQLPALGRLLSDENKQKQESEILVIVTPHVLKDANPGSTEIWLGPSQ